MTLITTVLAFVAALGCLIVIHEFGHYLMARWCNVKVLRFSIGFGKPLWRTLRGRDRTEWAVTAVPLGGYVKMLDEREGEVPPGELPRAFNRQPVLKRIAIVIAGPVANFLMAIALYWILFVHGIPGLKPVTGAAIPGTPAAVAGFKSGETIARIGEEPVRTWQDVRWILLQRAVQRTTTSVEVRNEKGEIAWRTLDLSGLAASDLDSDFLKVLGLRRFQPDLPPSIGRTASGGAAERAGLKTGDEIVSINNRGIGSVEQAVKTIQDHPGKTLLFAVRRNGAVLSAIAVTPDPYVEKNGRTVGRINAVLQVREEALAKYLTVVRYGPVDSMIQALSKTWETSVFSLKMLGKMIVGEVSLKNLSGPITIADYAGQSAQGGWISYLFFLALISISLGVLNLLPIPVLDGGHLMYYMLEIFKGSPVSDRAVEIGQHVGVALLFTLMALALYNDINRLISG